VPYFIILPGFVFYVVAISIGLVVTSLHRPTAWLRPYLASVLLWSSVGFVVSTVVYGVALVASLLVMRKLTGGKPSVLGGIALGGIVFIAPFLAAAAGILGGAALGIRRRWASRRSTNARVG
jgi:hypothetical protein